MAFSKLLVTAHNVVIRAMPMVWSDILMAADNQQVTLLALLDLSAAFDCVDRDILLSRLHFVYGISGAVLSWIRSFCPTGLNACHLVAACLR